MQLFKDTWALVTGASSGLGFEFARRLAHHGANVVVTGRNEPVLARLSADLARVNAVRAEHIVADLSRPGAAAELHQEIARRQIAITHLINNAGFGSAGPLHELDAEREQAMVRVNVEALVTLTRLVLPALVAQRRGGVLNVASTAGFQPVPFMATYGATKAFVQSFTLALAAELEGTGVSAMTLCPGPVRTGFQAAAGLERPGPALAELTAEQTVERALAAYVRGERLYTPGFVNGAQAVATKLLPRRLVSWAAVRAMNKLGRARRA
jgi:short-subunit dehydrogenase